MILLDWVFIQRQSPFLQVSARAVISFKDPVWTIRSPKRQSFQMIWKTFPGPWASQWRRAAGKVEGASSQGCSQLGYWGGRISTGTFWVGVTCWVFFCRCLSTWKALAHFRESFPIFWTFSTTVSKDPMTRYKKSRSKRDTLTYVLFPTRPLNWSMGWEVLPSPSVSMVLHQLR